MEKKFLGTAYRFFCAANPRRVGGGYANFFLTHMTKIFTKQSRFKAKIVHIDLLTPSLHQCEDYGPGSTCKAWWKSHPSTAVKEEGRYSLG